MEQHDREELAEVNAARKGFYEFLASMYKLELTDEQIGTLTKQDLPTDAEYVGAGYATVKEYLRHRDSGTRQELAVDYARVFLCAGMYEQLMAPPYESVYTSPKRLMMQDARDEVLVLYRAFGLDKQESWKEGEDHIALELEFEQILCERAIAAYEAGDEDECLKLLLSQRNFLEDHLLAWYPMMAADLQKFPQTDFYKGLGKLTDGFLRNDREFLDAALSENEAEVEVA